MPFAGPHKHLLVPQGQLNVNQVVPFVDGHGNDPGGTGIGEGRQFRFFHDPLLGDHDDGFTLQEIPDGQNRRHAFSRCNIDQVDDGLPFGGPPALGNLINLQPVDFPLVRKDQDIMMGRGDEDLFDKILFLGAHADLALAAPALAFVEADGIALDIAVVGNGHHHVFFDDHVFDVDILGTDDDFRAAFIAVAGLDLFQFGHDDIEHFPWIIQNTLQGSNQTGHFRVFRINFFPFQTGQALQAHLQNGLGLNLRETESLHRGPRRPPGDFSIS